MWWDNEGRPLIHSYNSNNDDYKYSWCLITSLPSISGLLSVHDPTAQDYGEDKVSISRIQYALCLTSGIYVFYFVCYKDHMS